MDRNSGTVIKRREILKRLYIVILVLRLLYVVNRESKITICIR